MSRAERLAQNEILFRSINERMKELQSDRWRFDEIDFMCECSDVQCTEIIRLPAREYERIRSDPTHFAVLPGHEVSEVEDVVERHDGYYLVVEKHKDTEEQVLESDPRS